MYVFISLLHSHEKHTKIDQLKGLEPLIVEPLSLAIKVNKVLSPASPQSPQNSINSASALSPNQYQSGNHTIQKATKLNTNKELQVQVSIVHNAKRNLPMRRLGFHTTLPNIPRRSQQIHNQQLSIHLQKRKIQVNFH